jgi:hypothetical protein
VTYDVHLLFERILAFAGPSPVRIRATATFPGIVP